MPYYGYEPEQTKAQIRSTRGETIDLALPVTCLVGELRTFLIKEYGYDPNTRLLYNGLVTDDNSYVCDYPFGSLIIALPADTQPQHQLPSPRHPTAAHQPPQKQHALPEPTHPATHHFSTASTSADAIRKNKTVEVMPTHTNAAARKMSPTDTPLEIAKAKRDSTVVKDRFKNSARSVLSTSSERARSHSRPTRADGFSAPTRTFPHPSTPTPPPVLAPARNGPSPAPGSGRAVSGTSARSSPWPQGSQDATEALSSAASSQAANLSPSPHSAQSSAAAEGLSCEDSNGDDSQRRRVRLMVECNIPSLNQVVSVPINSEFTVSDLIRAVEAAVPTLTPEAQVVYRGKLLPKSLQAKLFDSGIRSDARVFIAAGEYSNTEKITLLEIEADTAVIESAMKSPLTDPQRKGYYEELMRILFRTDGLQSLEGKWRQRRKDVVKHITSLQDKLGVDVKVS
nr:unnamed protein product [Leishmania braziliensis]